MSTAVSLLGLTVFAAAAAKSLQSCPTLCDPIDGSPLGSPVPGILQARILEWVAISFSGREFLAEWFCLSSHPLDLLSLTLLCPAQGGHSASI